MAPPDKETSKWRGERKEEKEEERDLPSLRYELLSPLSLSPLSSSSCSSRLPTPSQLK